ncbi:hypothetical protein QVD17_35361 [Tagetes erecta]|uniref:Uncharacterized protein n=1 Tax=Tagetes erecta TaxID=13708 RepID=A0AAD8JZB6_TARER|nr:hypothetical protein QVD17_35361 [Tagetes erecta]
MVVADVVADLWICVAYDWCLFVDGAGVIANVLNPPAEICFLVWVFGLGRTRLLVHSFRKKLKPYKHGDFSVEPQILHSPPSQSQNLKYLRKMAPAAGNDAGVSDHSVVFIDTNLDTHLAMIVSDSDTVSDFKGKVMLEHRKLFPVIGDIRVECLKVKQRGNFYHLSDSMLVKNAFDSKKRNWFVSVDVSRLEQNDGIQHLGKHHGDQLALPWVTHSHSIERQVNHGSPSVHSKTVPFVNQNVFNLDLLTSADSCKDGLKNVEEDGLCDDTRLDYELQEKLDSVKAGINSKKRTRGVHNESPLKDFLGAGPSVKKKRKTERVKNNVKASEEHIALTYDNDKVNDENAIANNFSNENNRANIGEIGLALDQVATAVPSLEGAGSETAGDVAMVVENNTQEERPAGISQMEEDSELVRKPAMENEIPSSLMRTLDCEHDAAGVTVEGHMKHSAKNKEDENEVVSTSFIEKLHNANKDAIESSSKQDVGTDGKERAGGEIDKYKNDSEVSLTQKPELKLPGRKKGTMGSESIGEGKRRKSKKLFKHSDNLVGISSTVPASVIDERQMIEDLEKTSVDAKKDDEVIVKEVGVSVENMEEKSRKEFTDTNDVVTVTNEESMLQHSESMKMNDAEIPAHEKNTSQVTAQGISDHLERQNEKMDDATKKRKKRKTKKSAGRNEEELIPKHVDGGISSTGLASIIDESKMDEVSEKTLMVAKEGDGVIVEEVDISVKNMEEKSRKEFTDTNDAVTITNEENLLHHSESITKNDAEISAHGKNTSQVTAHGISDNLERQNEKMDDAENKRKKRKSKKSAGRNEELITKHFDGDTSSTVLASVIDDSKVKEVSEKTLMDAKKSDDVIVEEVELPADYMEEKSRKEFTDANDVVTVANEENVLRHSESMMNNDAEISTLGKNSSQVNAQGISNNLEKQNEKMDDTTKKRKKRKTTRSAGRNEDELKTKYVDGDIFGNVKEGDSSLPDADRKDGDKVEEKDAQISPEGLVEKAENNDKSQDLPSKHQSNEVELESKKSQSVDHHHLPEKTLKNASASEVSKVNNEVGVPEDESHELDFRDYFTLSRRPKKVASIDNRKDMKKTKDDPRNDRSRKPVSKNVNNKVSIDNLKTPKQSSKINAQKTSKQQLTAGQANVKSLKKKSVNCSRQVKSVLNTPGTIFGDDVTSVNSDSSTRTPSGKSSSSSSSSGGSFCSQYSRRSISHIRKGQAGAGKNNVNSQSESKRLSLTTILRSSSRFKKVKSQVEDTESQPVEFVPDSQPMGM